MTALCNVLAFSPDGTKVAMAEALGMITEHRPGKHRLWDVVTGKPLGPAIPPIARSGAGIQSGRDKGCHGGGRSSRCRRDEVRLWDAATGQPLGQPMKHDAPVTAVAFSPDGTKLATRQHERRPAVGRGDGPTAGPADEA